MNETIAIVVVDEVDVLVLVDVVVDDADVVSSAGGDDAAEVGKDPWSPPASSSSLSVDAMNGQTAIIEPGPRQTGQVKLPELPLAIWHRSQHWLWNMWRHRNRTTRSPWMNAVAQMGLSLSSPS